MHQRLAAGPIAPPRGVRVHQLYNDVATDKDYNVGRAGRWQMWPSCKADPSP